MNTETFQTEGVKDNLPIFRDRLAERLTFPLSWLSGNHKDFNWSHRGGAGYEGQHALASNLMHLGMSLAAESLSTRPEVDGERVAAMGLSMGSFRTWQVAALSDRIAAGVAVCWMATVKWLMVAGNNQTRSQSAFAVLHPT